MYPLLHVRRLCRGPRLGQSPRCLSVLSVSLCSLGASLFSMFVAFSLLHNHLGVSLFSRCLSVFPVPCSLPDLHVCRHFHEDVCVASSPQSPLLCGHHRATQRAPQSRTVAGTNGQVSDAMCMQATYSGTYSGTCITRVCTCTILVCVHVLWNLFDHRMQLQALACLPEDFTWWHYLFVHCAVSIQTYNCRLGSLWAVAFTPSNCCASLLLMVAVHET